MVFTFQKARPRMRFRETAATFSAELHLLGSHDRFETIDRERIEPHLVKSRHPLGSSRPKRRRASATED